MSDIGMMWQINRKDSIEKNIKDALIIFSQKYGGNPSRIEISNKDNSPALSPICLQYRSDIQKGILYLIKEE